jgi:hypothetical protein
VKRGPVLLVIVLVSACLAAGAAVAATFSDPVGDTIVIPQGADVTGVTAVDLTSIDVSNTPAGLVTFRLTVTSQTLPPNTILGAVLNTDRNAQTGDEGIEVVIDYVVAPNGTTEVVVARWNGTELVEVPSTATSSFAGGVLTITVPRSELVNTQAFDFEIVALVFRADLQAAIADVAPDTVTGFTYELVGIAPPAPSPPPRLTASKPTGVPARPRPGRRFSVSTGITRQDTGAAVTSGNVACSVRVGVARVRTAGRFTGGRARCTMTVPRTTKGKTLRGTITIRSAGATVTRAFSFRVA